MSAGEIVRVAEAVLPVPPLVEVTAPLVLLYVPLAEPVTSTLTVQLLLAATAPPVSEMLPEPAVAVTVPVQVPPSPFGVATTRPAGSVSVNATPVSATAFAAGLVMVKVNVETPFTPMAVGLKALAIDGGATTFSEAEAVPPVPPSVEVTFPVVLFLVPAVVPVTLIEKVQEVLPARVAPERLTTPVPAVAVMVPPPQDPVSPLGVATTRPAGKVSLNAIPLSAVEALLF